jgi:predicted 2-oxoglutarate/Fe(II)-dependent dioxygenase YbiX
MKMREPFLIRELLDPAECRTCQLAMDAGAHSEAAVLEGDGVQVDPARRAGDVDVAPEVLGLVETRLDRRLVDVARHFGLALTGREGSGFVRYPPGGFYRRHVDRAKSRAWPAAARRRVSAVIFLNAARGDGTEGEFEGGVLRLYPSTRDVIEIVPRRGLLVAFSATMPHEVTVVTGGVRDAVVDWYY